MVARRRCSSSLKKLHRQPIIYKMAMDEVAAGRLDRAYEVLHLGEEASLDQVKRAYATLIRTEKRSAENWVRLKEMDWAYEVLSEYLSKEPTGVPSAGRSNPSGEPHEKDDRSPTGYAREWLFPTEEEISPPVFYGKAFFTLILIAWGIRFIFAPIEGDYVGRSFMHLINLPFHESGHVIFSFFGDFIRVLGGTLCQVLVPLVCMVEFLRRSDVFAAACALWWVGQSFIDAAPYIYDARAGELMLLGGVTGRDAPDYHDWHNILDRLGLLSWDHSIAYASKTFGAFLILASLAWCAWYLHRHRRDARNKGV
jgi:hypothetical protein